MREMDLLIPQELENELAGIAERGARPPLVRIPGKTHLSTVLLSSNPWEQRDLDRKLQHIQTNRSRKVKSLEWSQRQFLIGQIFDQDYNLRFTKDQTTFADPKRNGIFSIPSTACMKKRNSQEHFDTQFPKIGVPQSSRRGQKTGGLGIFAPSLSARGKMKDKLETTSKSTPNLFFTPKPEQPEIGEKSAAPKNDDSEKNISQIRDTGEKDEKHETTSLPPISEMSERYACSLTPSGRNNLSRHPTLINRAHFTKLPRTIVPESVPTKTDTVKDHVLHKASSLPAINLFRHDKFNHDLDDREESETSSDREIDLLDRGSPVRSANSTKGELCKADVIKEITKTLPMSLMIKANQNVNKVVNEKKKRLILKCKQIAERDLVSDPRYVALQRSLIKPQDEE